MMRALLLLLLCCFIALPAEAIQKDVYELRVNPVIQKNRRDNEVIFHISRHLVINIPANYSIDDIDCNVRCSFEISPEGKISNIELDNQPDIGLLVQFKPSPKLSSWLQRAMIEGLQAIPPLAADALPNIKTIKRVIIFNFGQPVTKLMKIEHIGYNPQAVNESVMTQIDSQRKALFADIIQKNKKWDEFMTSNIKQSHDLKLSKPNEVLRNPLQKPIEDPLLKPKTQVTVTMQR